jgi:hypothetical protein
LTTSPTISSILLTSLKHFKKLTSERLASILAFSIAFSASLADETTSTMHFDSSISCDFFAGSDSSRAKSSKVCVRAVAVLRTGVEACECECEGVPGVMGE